MHFEKDNNGRFLTCYIMEGSPSLLRGVRTIESALPPLPQVVPREPWDAHSWDRGTAVGEGAR